MLSRIIRFLEGRASEQEEAMDAAFDRRHVAAAALLVEASRIDTEFDADERAKIKALVADRFGLGPEDAEALIAVAERRQDEVYSDWMFTQAIATGFTEAERADVIAMLWEVAYADGTLHRFEEHMIQRVAEELGVNADFCEAARQRALQALGMADPKAR